VVLAQVDVRSGVEKIIGNLGPYPAAFAYGSLVVMIPFRGFSLAPDGKSFLTSIFRAHGEIWLISGFDADVRQDRASEKSARVATGPLRHYR
jgi:hypothetical protein